MTDVVTVKSRTEEGAQALLDLVCRSGELVPVMEPQPMLGRSDRWQAEAAPAGQALPPRRPPTSRIEYQLRRRGHR
jgi:hypothetical protein